MNVTINLIWKYFFARLIYKNLEIFTTFSKCYTPKVLTLILQTRNVLSQIQLSPTLQSRKFHKKNVFSNFLTIITFLYRQELNHVLKIELQINSKSKFRPRYDRHLQGCLADLIVLV